MKVFAKLKKLIKEIAKTPFEVAENLTHKNMITGCWSPRITNERGLIYKIQDD